MRSLKNPKTILSSSISDSDGFPVIINITVLSNSFPISSSFLPKNGSVLLCKSRSKSAVSGIKSLLLQNFGIFGINKLTQSSRGKARGKYNFNHHFHFSAPLARKLKCSR